MNQTGTILIIEDDRAIRRLVKNAMMANGYSVLEAETAKDGVRQEEQKRLLSCWISVFRIMTGSK